MSTGFDKIEKAIQADSSLDETEKEKILSVLLKCREKEVNILITGATGAGKSSTINAMFNMEVAKVGTGADPETMDIKRFKLGKLILWDSPGLGDGKEADARHSAGIIKKLLEKDENGDLLIDIVLVVLDGGSKDLGTSYELINEVIIPNLDDNSRLLIGINQADMIMKGRYWDHEHSQPLEPLQKQINDKEESIKRRIYEATGVTIEPVAYSAGLKEDGFPQCKPYNLSKLLCYIIEKIPQEKRVQVIVETNKEKGQWEQTDNKKDYNQEIRTNVGAGILASAGLGAEAGKKLGTLVGEFIPVVGPKAGAAIGALVGAIGGAVSHIFSGCFITTATCQSFGKSDDCYELNMFRNYRDEWLYEQSDGRKLIKEYYYIAPQIVSAIDNCQSKNEIYKSIWEKWLSDCLILIENGNYNECKEKYVEMTNNLKQRYLA